MSQNSQLLADAIRLRDVGYLRICFVRHYNEPLAEILRRCGLNTEHWPDPAQPPLHAVDFAKAQAIIAQLLRQDLAYGSETAAAPQAQALAAQLLAPFAVAGSVFYTNGIWGEDVSQGPQQWCEMTDATFDGGVIAVAPQLAVCIWVEDED